MFDTLYKQHHKKLFVPYVSSSLIYNSTCENKSFVSVSSNMLHRRGKQVEYKI